MKAEELFVGALVRVNREGLCIKKDTIVEVRAVDADDKLIEKGLIGSAHCRPLDDNQFDGGIWCEYLDPIPLTPEILEKNGFSGEGYNMGIVGFSVEPIPDEKDGYEVFIWKDMCLQIEHGFTHFKKYIKYVHHLQHALRICGIEKEIEL